MSATERFECERHPGTWIESGSMEGCGGCIAMLSRPVESMTGDEKADEVRSWITGWTSIPFGRIHERLEQLVGRGVFTHEIGLAPDRLIEEARGTRTLVSEDEIINDLRNTGKPVIEIRLER